MKGTPVLIKGENENRTSFSNNHKQGNSDKQSQWEQLVAGQNVKNICLKILES